MSSNPSRRVRDLFAEAEQIAGHLVELAAEERRLRETLKKVWRARTVAMATLALKAEEAAGAEVAESAKGRKR